MSASAMSAPSCRPTAVWIISILSNCIIKMKTRWHPVNDKQTETSRRCNLVVITLQKSIPVEPTNYVIEATKKEKRTRTYSVDDNNLAVEHAYHPIYTAPHHSRESLGRQAESVQLMTEVDGGLKISTSGEFDIERQGRRRSRQISKVSYDEKKPFDRKVSAWSRDHLTLWNFMTNNVAIIMIII